jgi:hypothetical protein
MHQLALSALLHELSKSQRYTSSFTEQATGSPNLLPESYSYASEVILVCLGKPRHGLEILPT